MGFTRSKEIEDHHAPDEADHEGHRRPESAEPQLYWDHGDHKDALPGFGVLVSGKTATRSYIVQRDLPNGLTRRVTIGNVNELDLATARQRAGDILQTMRQGKDPKVKCNTLRETLTAYRKAHEHRLRTTTDKDYADSISRHLGDWLDRPMAEITREMVETRHKAIAEEVQNTHRAKALESAKRYEAKAKKVENGWQDAAVHYRALAEKARHRKPYNGHAAANGAMRALRLLWNYAADKNKTLGANPVKLGKQWFTVHRRTRLVKADDLPKFYAAMQALKEPLWRDYLTLLLFSGLRREEAAQLKWRDVDLRAKLLRIPAAETKADRKLDLPLSDVPLDMMVARRALGDATFVFPANSKSGHVEEPKFAFDLIAKACGLRVSPHDLRTFATVAESCDISTSALKALINHSLGSDVTSGYIVMPVERLRKPMQLIADKLQEYCDVPMPAGGNVIELQR